LKFIKDLLTSTKILSLPTNLYGEVVSVRENLSLDFDDAYQYSVGRYFNLSIVTMDKDFEVIKDLEILFL